MPILLVVGTSPLAHHRRPFRLLRTGPLSGLIQAISKAHFAQQTTQHVQRKTGLQRARRHTCPAQHVVQQLHLHRAY